MPVRFVAGPIYRALLSGPTIGAAIHHALYVATQSTLHWKRIVTLSPTFNSSVNVHSSLED